MPWDVRVAEDAQRSLARLPQKDRRRILRSLSQLEADPYQGNVKPLKGNAWKGFHRKRSGDYRIVFFLHQDEQIIDVPAILRRSEKTYR
jgi:mRNA-degrading endonuclease RelE of RelBE toxin-antitoxin system